MKSIICNNEKEIWKDIPDFEKLYQISNLGRVRRKKDNYIFKENKNSGGYRVVTLTKNKKDYSVSVHRIVANVFIKKIKGKNFINHIDGNKMNNRVDNLEWCTQSENMYHAYKNKLEIKQGKKVIQYDLKMNIIKIWNKISDAEKELKISHGKISMVCKNKRKKAGGYIWKYYEKI